MNDQSLIEQDIDSFDRCWMDDCSWMADDNLVPEREERYRDDGIIEFINQNPILVSIIAFIIGSLLFFLVGSAAF